MENRRNWLIYGAIIAAVIIFASRAGIADLITKGSQPPSVPDCSQAINWQDSRDYIGETQTVRGTVVNTFHAQSTTGQPTFINIGRDHPDPNRFTIVVWSEDREAFSSPPEQQYQGRVVCAAGEIYEHDGVAQIIVSDPRSIEIVQ